MDLGGLDGLLCSDNNNTNSLISTYDLDPNLKSPSSSYGFKHDDKSLSLSVSATANAEGEWRDLKMPKIRQPDFAKGMLLQQQRSNCSSVYSDSLNMLSFSSPNTQQASTLPYYARNNTGYGVRGVIAGVRGPFTPSQWMELEHQALIYKYITFNAPIPSNLLIPIRKALETVGFSSYPGNNLRQTAYGWGGFHLGFSNNSDPEPGRCRRTDGKKWRCSRDAVADQKYCERHMNRGRHRSRKPVEGQSGHSVSNGPTTTSTAAAAAKVSAAAAAVSTNSTIISHLNHHQLNTKMQPATAINPTAYSHDNRSFLNRGNLGCEKIQDSTDHSLLKQNPNSVPSEFGFVCSDSLLNPLQKKETGGVQKSQNSLRQFMDDWPHSDRTQLSISIPMTSSDFMSSNSSPISETVNHSPLRMGLGVGNTSAPNVFDEKPGRVNWNPVSWESSMGGPLGEVLNHSTNNSPSTSALNLMTDGWESSQHTALSPTGVLQKTAFGCFSNSSAGSSPRTDNSLLGSTLITPSLPLL